MRSDFLNALLMHACAPGAARVQPETCPARVSRRMEALVALLALFSVAMPLRAAVPSGCELLPPAVVSSVAGETVHLESMALQEHNAGPIECRYLGKNRLTLTFSVLSLESEGTARSAFEHELARIFGAGSHGELLRGVGAEARFGVSQHTRDNTIVARHGITIFALAGYLDQGTLVILARSVIARLERAAPV